MEKLCWAENPIGLYSVLVACQQNPQAHNSCSYAQLHQESDYTLMETSWVITSKEARSSPSHTTENVSHGLSVQAWDQHGRVCSGSPSIWVKLVRKEL